MSVLAFRAQFRLRLCVTMVVDYGGAWLAEIVLKHLFADNQPKPIITKGIERREARRAEEKRLKDAENARTEVALAEKKDL